MSEQADAARERVLAALRSVEITGADGAWTAVLDEVQALEALDAYGAVMRVEGEIVALQYAARIALHETRRDAHRILSTTLNAAEARLVKLEMRK